MNENTDKENKEQTNPEPEAVGSEQKTDGEKKKKDAKLLSCMIVSNFDVEHFKDWTDEELLGLAERDPVKVGRALEKRLTDAGGVITNAYIIFHDRDVNPVFNDKACTYDLVPAEIHFHFICRFEKQKLTIKQIASAVGLTAECVQKPSSGRFGWDNFLAYLTHVKYSNKFQYKPDDVVTLCGKPYSEIYAERFYDWDRGRGAVTKTNSEKSADWLVYKLGHGEISRNEMILNREYYDIYLTDPNKFERALNAWTDYRIVRLTSKLNAGEFETAVLYITGKPNAGKTYIAKRLISDVIAYAKKELDERWTMFRACSSNSVDNYDGSEIVLMDDLRGASMTAPDWLALLDPENTGPISARYHNRIVPARLIIITAHKPVIEFFYYLKNMGGGDRSESMSQFLRRIMACVHALRIDGGGKPEHLYAIGERNKIPETEKVVKDNGKMDEDSPHVTVEWEFNGNVHCYDLDDASRYLLRLIFGKNGIEYDPGDLKEREMPDGISLEAPDYVPDKKDGPGEENEYFDKNYKPSQKLLDMERGWKGQITNENGDPIF